VTSYTNGDVKLFNENGGFSEVELVTQRLESVANSAIAEDSSTSPAQEIRTPRVFRVLDSLGYGGILLAPEGWMTSFNVRARGCFGEGLALRNGAVVATDRKIDLQLQGMIKAALSGKDYPVSLAVQRPAKLPLIIRALCLDKGLLLIVLDPEASLAPPENVLTQTFGLTPTEVEITIGIASGKSLSEIAAKRGVKVGTVRAHSKVVFSKTQTRGQADLMRVLTRLAVFMPKMQSLDAEINVDK